MAKSLTLRLHKQIHLIMNDFQQNSKPLINDEILEELI